MLTILLSDHFAITIDLSSVVRKSSFCFFKSALEGKGQLPLRFFRMVPVALIPLSLRASINGRVVKKWAKYYSFLNYSNFNIKREK
jgi:hypothetical protein